MLSVCLLILLHQLLFLFSGVHLSPPPPQRERLPDQVSVMMSQTLMWIHVFEHVTCVCGPDDDVEDLLLLLLLVSHRQQQVSQSAR